MASMVDRMLEQAEELVARHPRSGAARRRAVSAAYYAAFHKILALCADAVLSGDDEEPALYEKVYRSIDHGPLKNAFEQRPLKSQPAFGRIGTLVAQLQSARMIADYSPPRANLFKRSEVVDHIARAREIVDELDALNEADRKTLAIHLLFKSRSGN